MRWRFLLVFVSMMALPSCIFGGGSRDSKSIVYTAPYEPIPGVPEIARKPHRLSPVYKPSSYSNVRYHTVKKGETLWKISQKYGLDWKQIQKANNLKNTNIWAGLKLRIPS